MGGRLHNTLSFVGLVVGVPTSLPHGLNVTGVAINPDVVIPQVGGFIVTADTINVTVTRLITSPGPNLNVLVTAWHSILREFGLFGPSQPAALSIQPFIVDLDASSSSAAAPVTCFVFRPGGIAGANVYTTWPTLMAAVVSVQGCKQILIDDSIAPALTTPIVSNMTDATLIGLDNGSQLDVVEGTTLPGLRHVTNNLTLNFTGVTAPITGFGGVGTVANTFFVENAAVLTSTGSPLIDNDSGVLALFIYLIDGSAIINNGGPVVHTSGLGGATRVLCGPLSQLDDVLSSVAAASTQVRNEASDAIVSEAQSAVVGPYLFLNLTKARFDTSAINAVGPTSPSVNTLTHCDASGGPFTVTLPFAVENTGRYIAVKKAVPTTNVVTVAAQAGDTVDGAASIALTAPLDSCWLVSDGVSNWSVIVQPLASASEPSALPEQWEQQDVTAGQVSVPLLPVVSQLFNEITANRAGSIVGLRTRLTAAVTAGSATVAVSVNGVAVAVSVVLGIGSTGAGAVAAPGAVPFAAGDLISVLISTTAGFLPNTTDIGAWVEVAY